MGENYVRELKMWGEFHSADAMGDPMVCKVSEIIVRSVSVWAQIGLKSFHILTAFETLYTSRVGSQGFSYIYMTPMTFPECSAGMLQFCGSAFCYVALFCGWAVNKLDLLCVYRLRRANCMAALTWAYLSWPLRRKPSALIWMQRRTSITWR